MSTNRKLIKKRNSKIIEVLLVLIIFYLPCFVVFPLINAILYVKTLLLEFSLLNLMLAISCFAITVLFVCFAIKIIRDLNDFRIVAYFSNKIGVKNINTFISGQEIYRNIKYLDSICVIEKVNSITSYGFNDDLDSEEVQWHLPQDGLNTIFAIKKHLIADNNNFILIEELRRLEFALRMAHLHSTKFSLLLRYDGCNSLEIEKRKGSFW